MTFIINRDDQGRYYWELRSCAYHAEFERPKIVYNETSKELHALLDYDGLHINKTGFIILSYDAKYLLGLMNSKLMDHFFRCEFPSWGDPWNGGRIQFRGDRMKKLSIPTATKNQQLEIETRVKKIMMTKKGYPQVDISNLESEIDLLVYELYNLTSEEIEIVENTSRHQI